MLQDHIMKLKIVWKFVLRLGTGQIMSKIALELIVLLFKRNAWWI